jgi:hypothetical protein
LGSCDISHDLFLLRYNIIPPISPGFSTIFELEISVLKHQNIRIFKILNFSLKISAENFTTVKNAAQKINTYNYA